MFINILIWLGIDIASLVFLWLSIIFLSISLWRMIPAIVAPIHLVSDTLLLPHNDYSIPFLRWFPRRLTAFVCSRPPVKLLGTCPRTHHYDVPADNTWVLTFPFHFAFVTIRSDGRKWLFRFPGLRYDYEDKKHYYNLGAAWHPM